MTPTTGQSWTGKGGTPAAAEPAARRGSDPYQLRPEDVAD